ncbi:MAG: 2-C-methyl-D-erythritol 4-phosphate cytidylyltransferase [Puniceicoccales bacterium]|jgi:2-C-methyl-D-erythritol 4-phosphate cytidylyltransferase|nr:2-C-methyl-D-erythritol 4-phosphate cytidylyltransferase [Puniceicoccales bacterium]
MPKRSIAILLAGGSGSRMRGAVRDKCLEPLGGYPVITHSVRAFCESGTVGGLVIVCRDDEQQESIRQVLAPYTADLALHWARGGAERQASVLNGLEACPVGTDLAFIHDVARPLVPPQALNRLAAIARRDGGAVLAHRVKDTIKRVPPGTSPETPVPLEDLERPTLWAMETPQVFPHALILAAYRHVATARLSITDDAAAVATMDRKVSIVENLLPNPKITEPHDLHMLEFLLGAA